MSLLSGVDSTQTQCVASPTSMPAAWACWTGIEASLAHSSASRRVLSAWRAARRNAVAVGDAAAVGVVRTLRGRVLQSDTGASTIGDQERRRSGGGVGTGTSRPNGIDRD